MIFQINHGTYISFDIYVLNVRSIQFLSLKWRWDFLNSYSCKVLIIRLALFVCLYRSKYP